MAVRRQTVLVSLAFAGGEHPLRWRSATYISGGNTNAVYGGALVKETFASLGFEGPDRDLNDAWDVLWTHRDQNAALSDIVLPVRAERYVNHCGYFLGAGHKGSLAQHIDKVTKQPGVVLSPDVRHLRTFRLEDDDARRKWGEVAKAAKDQHWIIKPSTAGHSRGIQIFDSSKAVAAAAYPQYAVAQEYLENGLLLDGSKFHFRLYLFVPRWKPFSAYLFEDGVVFKSTKQYDRHFRDVKLDAFSGAADGNVQLLSAKDVIAQIVSSQNDIRTCPADSGDNCADATIDAATIWQRIARLLQEALGSEASLQASFGPFEATLSSRRGYSCFDLFGLDVMLDEHFKPVLLEINDGPNMWVDERKEFEPVLRSVKAPLMTQIATWLGEVAGKKRSLDAEAADTLESATLRDFMKLY